MNSQLLFHGAEIRVVTGYTSPTQPPSTITNRKSYYPSRLFSLISTCVIPYSFKVTSSSPSTSLRLPYYYVVHEVFQRTER